MVETPIGAASTNFRRGRAGGAKPEAIVIHIVVGSLKSCDSTFLDPNMRRSAHYGVGRDGRVHRYVSEEDTAYHAGVVDDPKADIVRERPSTNPNSYTIGIEHGGFPGDVWPEAQIASSAQLIARACLRWQIPCDRQRVLMHREIRASKTCPGLTEGAMEALVARARANLASPPAGGPFPAAGTRRTKGFPRAVRITKRVHLRAGRPSAASPSITVLPVGAEVLVDALVVGDSAIRSQPVWCELTVAGAFFWSGAIDPQPTPSDFL